MLGKTMGRGQDLAERFTGESKGIADLEVRSRMAGRWVMSTIQMTFAIQPAIIYWLAGQSFLGAHASRSARSSRSPRCRRGCCSRSSRCSASAPTSRPRWRCSIASSSTSTFRSTSSRPATRSCCAPRRCSARCASRTSRSATPRRRPPARTLRGRCAISISRSPAGTRTAIVGETGSGKTTLGYLAARLYEPQEGRLTIDGIDIRDVSLASLAATRRRRLPGDLSVPRQRAREPALRRTRSLRRGDRGRRAHGTDP